jgi:LPXTG-motif cell wall-anchored protein
MFDHYKLQTTGDNADTSHIPYLFGIFAASMCGIVLLTRKKKKKKA